METFRVPLFTVKPPEVIWLKLTGPATAELKITLSPLGITTFATFDKSGMAPPAQFAGSDQLPVAPPIQVTEDSWVMLAARPAGWPEIM